MTPADTPRALTPGLGLHRFRGDIQGLRAVAVLSVLVFHAGVTALPGELILHAFGRDIAEVQLDGEPADVAAVQQVADLFSELQVLPKPVDVAALADASVFTQEAKP